MRLIKSYLIFFLCFVFACEGLKKQSDQKIINIPDSLIIYETDSPDKSTSTKLGNLTLITTINVSCATCILELNKWRFFKEKNESEKFSLMPICYSKDNFEMIKYLFESGEIETLDFPIYFDKGNQFIELNKNFLDDNNNITILVDKEYKVLVQGNPLSNNKLMNEYLKYLK